MKIAIDDIPDEGLSLDVQEKLDLETIPVVSPVTAHLELHKTGQEVDVSGRLDAELEMECSRCLKKFVMKLDIPIDIVYHPVKELSVDRHELKQDEMDMGFYPGTELDLQEALKEQILLNVQMKPLCDEDCKGICSVCGKDLNTEHCSCETKEKDPRLAVLKTLLEKRKE